MRRQRLLWMALPAALLFSTACSDDDGNGGLNGTNGTNGTADVGPPDATEDAGQPDAEAPDATAPSACRFDQECGAGEVCNLLTGECNPGRSCTQTSDCDVCNEVPLSSSEDCGHGVFLTSYCDPNRSVCTRSRASCEPCETDADCGRVRFGPFVFPNYCIDYAEVAPNLSGKFCGRAAAASAAVFGFEQRPLGPNGENVYVNPQGCPAEPDGLFLCPLQPDGDGDGVADVNPECTDFQSGCLDDGCPGTGGLRCNNVNTPGVVGTCGDYCLDSDECPQARPFCNRVDPARLGVCQTGCSPGSCPNNQVCHSNGRCGQPCNEVAVPSETEIQEADDFCEENYGEDTYCNVSGPTRPLPTLTKVYRDRNACAPLGCELGQGEDINRDCGSQQVCNIDAEPFPACQAGCFSTQDCTPEIECNNDGDCTEDFPVCQQVGFNRVCVPEPLTLGPIFRCVDAPSGQVEDDVQECREAFFTAGLEEDNRDSDNPRIGTCCETGCIRRGSDCIGNLFCCGEPGSPYEEAEDCRAIIIEEDPADEIQATPGTCFEPPVQPFCQQCAPTMADPSGINQCNSSVVEGLVENPTLPYNPVTVWPRGENQDCEGCSPSELEDYVALGGQVNDGTPFYEVQRCVNIGQPMNPDYTVCTVAYDPKSIVDAGTAAAAGVPRGWRCEGRAPPCVDDTQCNGLECVGAQVLPDGSVIPGACKCGEDGIPTACPGTINGIPGNTPDINAPTRMRCVEARTQNYPGPASADVQPGDMFCVYTFDCAPPTLQFPDPITTPQTLPDACNIPAVYQD